MLKYEYKFIEVARTPENKAQNRTSAGGKNRASSQS